MKYRYTKSLKVYIIDNMRAAKNILAAILTSLLTISASFSQITAPLYVGNIKQATDEFDRPILSVKGYGALVEIRNANNGAIISPDTNGVSHPNNPLIYSCEMGLNSCVAGMFCAIFPLRINPTNRIFARTYNRASPQEATFYLDSPIYSPDNNGSSLVIEFGEVLPMDAGDSDGDGLNNSWEETFSIDDRPTPDYDGDGASDLQEMLAGTAPDDKDSIFKMLYITRSGISVGIGWTSAPSRTYQLQRNNNMMEPFIDVWNEIAAGDGVYSLFVTRIDTNRTSNYRVKICGE